MLRELKVPASNYNLCNEFKKMLSANKKQSAILLNDFFKQYPNDYYDFTLHNYSLLYDRFSETPLYPQGENLYDVAKYAMIGRFLSGHPDYEYDEISTLKLIGSNNSAIYCFKILDGNQYVYTIPSSLVEKIGKDKFRIIMEDVEVTLNLGESMSFKSKTKGKEAIIFTLDYSESSQLEDMEYFTNMENVSETEREKYKEKIKEIKEKIKEKNRTEM